MIETPDALAHAALATTRIYVERRVIKKRDGRLFNVVCVQYRSLRFSKIA